MRLLIAAGSAAETPARVPASVRHLIDEANEILVIAPTLPSRFEWLASATDKARKQADERLGAVLSHLREMGASSAEGAVAPDEPMLAFEEAIADFRPDHVLIALRGRNRADWQERGLLDQLLERFPLPVTVFVVTD
jgi:hypothetical protein